MYIDYFKIYKEKGGCIKGDLSAQKMKRSSY